MNRQIKFRVWCGNIKKFRRVNIDGPKNSVWGVSINKGIFEIPSSEFHVVELFTGLLDKNGKEIYEGDIVSIDTGSTIRSDYLKTPSYKKIAYSISIGGDYPFAGFTIININPSDLDAGVLLDCMNCQFLQIIGNVHENPALL